MSLGPSREGGLEREVGASQEGGGVGESGLHSREPWVGGLV